MRDRGAEHPGEPGRVRRRTTRAATRNRDRSSMMTEGGSPGRRPRGRSSGPRSRSRSPRRPRTGRTPAAASRPAGVEFAGGEPPLDRPLRRGLRPAEPGRQDPADLRRGALRVLHLQADRQVHDLGVGTRLALPRAGHQRLEPAVAARDDPPVQGPPRQRDQLPAVRPLDEWRWKK